MHTYTVKDDGVVYDYRHAYLNRVYTLNGPEGAIDLTDRNESWLDSSAETYWICERRPKIEISASLWTLKATF